MTEGLPTWTDWHGAAPRLRLRPAGGELRGPCPACGGHDRFHVHRGGGRIARGGDPAVVGCRGCIDGRTSAERRAAYGRIVSAAFGGRPRPDSGARPKPAPAAATSTALPGLLWRQSLMADRTPARRYLAGRLAWPPDGYGPRLPGSVRWLPAERQPARGGGWPGLPRGAAGAILFRYARGQSGAAVSIEALDIDGQRLPARWRRTFGQRAGAIFTAADGLDTCPIILTEGEVSALACCWTHPGATVLATGGTAGLAAWRLRPGDRGRRIIIEADGDRAGDRAARQLRDALPGPVSIRWRSAGDPADDLAADLAERAAIIEADGGLSRPMAERAAWHEVLTATDWQPEPMES